MSDVKRVEYVVPSKNAGCLLQNYGFAEAVEELQKNGIETSLYVDSEPKTSLAGSYNSRLNAPDTGEFDWIVFLHSDAAMDVRHFTQGLLALGDKYDAVGIAGAKRVGLSSSPLSWFTASQNMPEGRIGIVGHVTPVGSKHPLVPTNYGAACPDVTDDYVAAVDGVCIAVGRKVVENEKCRFDERFPFDFYDLDFSLTVNTLGLSLGVLVEPSFVHLSPGKGILKPEYLEVEKLFREKWNALKQ